ncbi:leucine-rich PPR motif-containing protein, mitochondrial [Cimex lectularius]|uniref:Leucine-rich PPR motif-containing protein, mitochondrial n=1 Tax=Cimex lectularius TaxID=79782 RepID=A0A8I6RMW0_CIMLE|nr:leucine-rich PPR motif-containing protein, mitochondrial [Cimex lectularius]
MSMLRSSKFVKYFISFARGIAINQPRGVDDSLLQKSRSLIAWSNRSFASASAHHATNLINRSLQKLDREVRRVGRISRKELQEVFDEIRLHNHATTTQSLMLIRCCGNLVPEETPEVRVKLVHEIWDTFEKLGVPFDISHYNALLRVHLENEHKFSPTEFLVTLEQKGIEPNRVTYQRLIMAYCQNGDIEGAKNILEFMKEKQMPVNESVFNALIIGHSQCNDMESAAGILSVMKQANLLPSADTYTALICGYAKQGDIEEIKKVLDECDKNEVYLQGKDILEVIYKLATNDHYEHIGMLLDYLKSRSNYNQDGKNVILRLIAAGEDKVALDVLKAMPKPVYDEEENLNVGNFFLRQIVKLNRPVDVIVEMCNEVKNLGNKKVFSVVVEKSLELNNPDTSSKLLTHLAKEEPVCFHYYWPVLVQYGKAHNLTGVLNTLRQMSQEVGQPPSNETLRDYVIPYFQKDIIGMKGIITLNQAGVSKASSASAFVAYLLSENQIKEACKLVLQYQSNYNAHFLRKYLVSAFIATKDISSFVTIVTAMESNDVDDVESGGRVLLDTVHYLGSERSKLLPAILSKFLENGISISNEVAELIQNKLSGDELTEEISTLLTKLTSPDLSLAELRRPNRSRHLEHDEEALLNLIKNVDERGENTLGLKKQLLMLYIQHKNIDKTLKLCQQLTMEGFEFHSNLLGHLFDLFINFNKLDEALNCLNKLKKHLGSNVDHSKIIKMAYLMYQQNKFDDALELINNSVQEEVKNNANFLCSSICWKFLNSLAESGDVEKLKTIFEALVKGNFISPSNVLLGPLIKVHILKGDMEKALEAFEECCLKYRATPWKNEIACKLIEKEDSTNLQRVTDLSTHIHGEVNSLYDLVLSFVECGRIRQARKILETPGLRQRTQRINAACERYTSEGRISHLESLVEVTKDLSHINRAEIYQYLLNSYVNEDNVDKAVGLWTQMQEEDVQPTNKFLNMLAKLMEKHNRTVPFHVPDYVEMEEENAGENAKNAISEPLRAFRTAIYNKDVDEAMELLQSKLIITELSQNDKSRLLKLMIDSGRISLASRCVIEWLKQGVKPNTGTLSLVINNLAKVGDIESFNAIGQYISKDVKKRISFVNRQTHCMVEAGRGEEMLNQLLNAISSANTAEELENCANNFPRGGIHSVLQVMPELLPKFEEIEKVYRDKGIMGPTNSLWIYYMINGQKEKAEKVWENFKTSDRFMFQPILSVSRQRLDVSLLDDLIEKSKTVSAGPSTFAVIYSCKLDIILKLNKEDEGNKVLSEALEFCPIEKINRNVLLKLKNMLEINGKEFKFVIPEKSLDATRNSSSSSDSDSESPEFAAKLY